MRAGTRAGGSLWSSALLVALDRLSALGAGLSGAFLGVGPGARARPGSGAGLVLPALLPFLLALFALGAAAPAATADIFALGAAAPPLFVLALDGAVATLLLLLLATLGLALLAGRTTP